MPSARQTGVLFVSLGARAMTPEYIDLIIGTAIRNCSTCLVILLDVAEETNLRVLEGLDEVEVKRRVSRYSYELTTNILRRWQGHKVILRPLSAYLTDPNFAKYRAGIDIAYSTDRSFKSLVHNQVYQNLQPVLNRKGVKNSRAEMMEHLAPYLLLELALKLYVANEAIADIEYAAGHAEMKVCHDIYGGQFAVLCDLITRRLAFVAVEGDLVLKDLCFRYTNAHYAVRDVNLCVKSGASYAIIGPNGSGKTTLLRIIAGHSKQHSGIVSWGGTDISELQPGERPTVTVFQDYALFPHMSALENVAFGLRFKRHHPYTEANQAAAEWLYKVKVPETFHSRLPAELSGGYQQRVAIARALALRPSILLLDEPTAALDVRQRASLGETLRDALASGWIHTLIVVSHDSDFAAEVCRDVTLLFDGRVMYSGDLQRLYTHPPTAGACQRL